MTKYQIIMESGKRHVELCNILSKFPDNVEINMAQPDYVRVKACSYDELKDKLRLLAREMGTYVLKSYYTNGIGGLAVTYDFGDMEVIIDVDKEGIEETLAKLGNGNCKIVDKVTTSKEVMCTL
jgi:hypothetical protein